MSVTQNHHMSGWSAAYREQVDVSVAAALFLRFFLAGLSTLSLGSRVRMRCGVLVLKSAWPLTWLGFLIWRSRSSSTPTGGETKDDTFCKVSTQWHRFVLKVDNYWVHVFSYILQSLCNVFYFQFPCSPFAPPKNLRSVPARPRHLVHTYF